MAEAVCTYYGANHQMVAQGFVFLADENGNRINWSLRPGFYKCKCGDKFIAEGSPESGAQIGKYVTNGGIIGSAVVKGVGVMKINSKLIRETTATKLPGFIFQLGNAN